MIYSITRLVGGELRFWSAATSAADIMRFVRYAMENQRQDNIYVGLHHSEGGECGRYSVWKSGGTWLWRQVSQHDDITAPALENLLSEVAVHNRGW